MVYSLSCSTTLSLYHDPPAKIKIVPTATTDVQYHHSRLPPPPSDLVQNPVMCKDEEEKSKLKRKRAYSSEAEDIDDATPWGCKIRLSLYDDPWTIKKVLTATDVQVHHNRLLLPSDLVQDLVCSALTDEEKSKLDAGKGTEIKFCDVNKNMSVHCLVLKKWASSGSFVLIGNWTGDFVKRRELKKGDEIGLQWDKFNHRFNFSVLQRSFS